MSDKCCFVRCLSDIKANLKKESAWFDESFDDQLRRIAAGEHTKVSDVNDTRSGALDLTIHQIIKVRHIYGANKTIFNGYCY